MENGILCDTIAGAYSSACDVGAVAIVVGGGGTAAAGAASAVSAFSYTAGEGLVRGTGTCVKNVNMNACTGVAGGVSVVQR